MNTELTNIPTSRLNLATSEDVRREMSRVYREARSLKLATQEATRLTYILTQILKAHELCTIENKLTALELIYSKSIK